ncbi:hypothetical protein BDP27DRAFT_1372945 [Rhodocollybia butyracea]|uniref:Uncharacterized protein n=1 Tax=Rhodocollybia butyracea TaxID=206335 RepID=A0A9P5P7F6_9AGAR|nr:hypothetical protein BDP27DRAFT_1372945 [Rhodocollybia butyracea]
MPCSEALLDMPPWAIAKPHCAAKTCWICLASQQRSHAVLRSLAGYASLADSKPMQCSEDLPDMRSYIQQSSAAQPGFAIGQGGRHIQQFSAAQRGFAIGQGTSYQGAVASIKIQPVENRRLYSKSPPARFVLSEVTSRQRTIGSKTSGSKISLAGF